MITNTRNRPVQDPTFFYMSDSSIQIITCQLGDNVITSSPCIASKDCQEDSDDSWCPAAQENACNMGSNMATNPICQKLCDFSSGDYEPWCEEAAQNYLSNPLVFQN